MKKRAAYLLVLLWIVLHTTSSLAANGLAPPNSNGLSPSSNASFRAVGTNIAIGSSAESSNTTGTNNVGIGYQVGSTGMGIGTSNILIGVDNTTTIGTSTASFAVAIGAGAQANDYDVAIGYHAGGSSNHFGHADTDLHSVAIGYNALTHQNNTANQNTAVGDSAGKAITTADSNTLVGLWAGLVLQTGCCDTAFGDGALRSEVTASGSTAVGHASLYRSTGSSNTAVGLNTGDLISSGVQNLVLGQSVASTTLTTGSYNILIGTGSYTDTQAAGSNNTLNIGNVIYATGLGTSGTTPAGNVSVGTSAPIGTAALSLFTSTSASIGFALQNGSGTCTHAAGSSSETVSCSSDIKFKAKVKYPPLFSGWLWDFPVRQYVLKSTGEKTIGVVAQELQTKHPEMVHSNIDPRTGEEYLSVDTPNPWRLVRAVQELQAFAALVCLLAFLSILYHAWHHFHYHRKRADRSSF